MPKATYHPSVMRWFKEARVLVYDREVPYRPSLLAEHVDLKDVDAAEKGGAAVSAGVVAS